MTKSTLNVHAGHDDYHCVDDTGFFQMFAKNAQAAADLNIIAHRIAELSADPGHPGAGRLPHHAPHRVAAPARARAHRGVPRRPTTSSRRRPPPSGSSTARPAGASRSCGTSTTPSWRSGQNQDSYMQSVAAQRPFFFDHIRSSPTRPSRSSTRLTGRRYDRVMTLPRRRRRVPHRRPGQRHPERELPSPTTSGRSAASRWASSTWRCSGPSRRTSEPVLKGKKGVASSSDSTSPWPSTCLSCGRSARP
jgi:hypothetical protein